MKLVLQTNAAALNLRMIVAISREQICRDPDIVLVLHCFKVYQQEPPLNSVLYTIFERRVMQRLFASTRSSIGQLPCFCSTARL